MERAEISVPPSPSRLPITVLLGLTLPPLALVSWVMLSGSDRALYLRSGWVRTGGVLLVAGALPLLALMAAAAIGLWPDPNPNPVGLGLFFLAAGFAGCLSALVGILDVTRNQARQRRPA